MDLEDAGNGDDRVLRETWKMVRISSVKWLFSGGGGVKVLEWGARTRGRIWPLIYREGGGGGGLEDKSRKSMLEEGN
jgi:hypothetical protein